MFNNAPYQIKKINDTYLVIVLAYGRITEYISEINNDSSLDGYNGEVIFDLLLSNGLSKRYFSAFRINSKIEFNTFKQKNAIEPIFKKIAASIYLENKNLLSQNFLPPTLVNSILSELG